MNGARDLGLPMSYRLCHLKLSDALGLQSTRFSSQQREAVYVPALFFTGSTSHFNLWKLNMFVLDE